MEGVVACTCQQLSDGQTPTSLTGNPSHTRLVSWHPPRRELDTQLRCLRIEAHHPASLELHHRPQSHPAPPQSALSQPAAEDLDPPYACRITRPSRNSQWYVFPARTSRLSRDLQAHSIADFYRDRLRLSQRHLLARWPQLPGRIRH